MDDNARPYGALAVTAYLQNEAIETFPDHQRISESFVITT